MIDTVRRRVRRDDSGLIDTSGAINPVASDLLGLAECAFLADREEQRGSSPDDQRWHRKLNLKVPVRDVALWSTVDVHDAVLRLLTWLTDDTWTVVFVDVDSEAPPRQLAFDLDDTAREVALFSGGLDAAAGVALHLPSTPLEAVGVVTNPVMRGYQQRVAAALQRTKLGPFKYTPVPFSVLAGARDDEPTRRTRGLVFLSCGVAAALQRCRERLLVFENGIGALNLPFTASQSGAMMSRAVHPLTLRLMSDLVSALLGRTFAVVNPCLPITKGELVSALPEVARDACAASESCDNAASGRGKLQRRCGYCTSCLLRRLSFDAARRSDWDPRPYLADSAENLKRDRLPEVFWQVATLDRTLRAARSDELAKRFPELGYVPLDVLDATSQRRLLAAYVDEWRRYPHPAVRRYVGTDPLGR